ncbi:hypothetical protein DENSPDRAFT_698868 [Dentipellis sp. KUC8613]|nr:hypothetical protein DENSPDRAFT_698868 [Dentipellis sp. KUC8613]
MTLSQHGVEFGVLVDGKPLVNHAVESQAGSSTVSAYIASKVGQTFQLSFKNKTDIPLSASVFMDGRDMRKTMLQPQHATSCRGVRTSTHSYKPFTFSALKLIDSDDTENASAIDYSKLGLIEVKVYRIKPNYRISDGIKGRDVADIDGIPEKSKKLGCHSVSLGPNLFGTIATRYKIQRLDPADKPFATFRLQYQSEEMLKAQGIIDPSAQDRSKRKRSQADSAESSNADRASKRQAFSSVKSTVKPERPGSPIRVPASSEGNYIDLTQIKMERPRSPIRVPDLVNGSIIDLTDAEDDVKPPRSPIRVAGALQKQVIDLTDD